MIEDVVVKALRVVADARGRLVEMLRSDDPLFAGFGQVHLSTLRPGIIKAWHDHERLTECFVVVFGALRVVLYDARATSPTHGATLELVLDASQPVLVRVPPGVIHGFQCVGDQEAGLLSIGTHVYDYAAPDERRYAVDDPRIPFRWPG